MAWVELRRAEIARSDQQPPSAGQLQAADYDETKLRKANTNREGIFAAECCCTAPPTKDSLPSKLNPCGCSLHMHPTPWRSHSFPEQQTSILSQQQTSVLHHQKIPWLLTTSHSETIPEAVLWLAAPLGSSWDHCRCLVF